jgi:ATP-dependent DNA helicase RecG
MVKSSDGFRIAEEDLGIRGPGEFFGTRQSGMPDLKVADIIRDVKILERARKEAFDLIDSGAASGEFSAMGSSLRAFWKGKAEFYKTG